MYNMNLHQVTRSSLLVLSLVLTLPVFAEMGSMMGKQNKDAGMMQMSEMMHDMGNNAVSMAGEMEYGNLNSTQQKQMAKRIRNMALMMDKMSNMMGKDMIMDDAQQRQMNDMRNRWSR